MHINKTRRRGIKIVSSERGPGVLVLLDFKTARDAKLNNCVKLQRSKKYRDISCNKPRLYRGKLGFKLPDASART